MIACFEWFTTWIKLVEASHLQGVREDFYRQCIKDAMLKFNK